MSLLYRIESLDSNRWVIKIEEQPKNRRILYLDTLKKLAKEEDKEALAFLTKIHLRSPNVSRSLDTVSFQQIELSAAQFLDSIQMLIQTQKLYWSGTVLKLGAAAKLYWKGEKHSEKACTISAVLQVQGEEHLFEQCEKVFPNGCFLKGKFHPIQTSVSWKWVELFMKGPIFLEGVQKKKFLEEEPPILWKEVPAQKTLSVLPRLLLSDQTGCFANLWMDYGDVGLVSFEDFSPTVGGVLRLKKEESEWERDLLEAGFQKKIVGNSFYYCTGDKVKETLRFLLELGWTIFDFKGRKILKQTDWEWDLREEEGSLILRGKAIFQGLETTLRKVAENRSVWIELDSNSVGLIDWKGRLDGEWEGESLRLKKASIGSLMPLLEMGRVRWEENVKLMAEGLKEGASFENALPSSEFQGTLLPYQQKGVDWLSFLYRWGFSALLADEMGLGKTVQVLAFFSRLRTKLPILIIAPSSLLYNWKFEIEKFLPKVRVRIHSGPERTRETSDFEGVIITSYTILRLDEELFSRVEFETIILDESNAIKTAMTQTAKAACQLKGRFKIALSGTPLENRPEELWSQFKFLMPELLGEKSEFQKADIEVLKTKIRPFILRRKKSEVQIELPEKIEQISWVEMNEDQASTYQSYHSGCRKDLFQGDKRANRMEILEAILRLRQISLDPRLVGEPAAGAKIDLLLQDLEDLGEEKVLIYSQFTSMLHLVGKALTERGMSYLYLDGSVSSEARAELVRRFQEEKESKLFLLSLKAGGVGLNLTAADYVFLLDPWWNEAVERQAIDRAHRIGRKKTVIAKRYLTPHSIEEKMLSLKEKKKAVEELLLDGEASSWTEEDLLHLLS